MCQNGNYSLNSSEMQLVNNQTIKLKGNNKFLIKIPHINNVLIVKGGLIKRQQRDIFQFVLEKLKRINLNKRKFKNVEIELYKLN